ncbi:MAG TPA: DNA-directed RNA polymerase subunit D [Methanomicrobia archaeon]|nr:DNA-directed RNA polymerase [Candidatus Alkanophaga volatiphilum]HDO63545.1 DNA-directed RNA polymerase subunit D [Methanomicrobia archaeon]HEX59138.1 DNA-directed RNA polymerase subunit D [Methanomicrobia archaeon]
MEVEILELTDLAMKFILRGVKPYFANALRRAMMTEVPKLAIDEVNVYENTSPLFDEILALRLALIPLRAENIDEFVFPEDCECKGEGCGFCQVSFTLTAQSPEEVGQRVVYSNELVSSDERVRPYPNIPIVKLISREVRIDGIKTVSRQSLMIEAIARLGVGKKHAKWQPVTACGYKNMPIVEIDEEKCDACGKCVEECPKRILEVSLGTVTVKDEKLCSLCKLCESVCDRNAIKVLYDKQSFVFNVESDGSYDVWEIVLRAVKALKEKYMKLKTEIAEVAERTKALA